MTINWIWFKQEKILFLFRLRAIISVSSEMQIVNILFAQRIEKKWCL